MVFAVLVAGKKRCPAQPCASAAECVDIRMAAAATAAPIE
jgi:hypothetical protein